MGRPLWEGRREPRRPLIPFSSRPPPGWQQGLALGCSVGLLSPEAEQRATTTPLGSALNCLPGNAEMSGLGLSKIAICFCPILSWLSGVMEPSAGSK